MTQTSAIIQARAGQDFTISGHGNDEETGRPFVWTVVADGHGTDGFINIVRATDFRPHVGKADPISSLVAHFKTFDGTYRPRVDNIYMISKRTPSGCTFILIKMYDNEFEGLPRKLEGYNVGDSQFAVYVDGVRTFLSTPHNMDNPKEVERLKDRPRVRIIPEANPIATIISPTDIKAVACTYVLFEDKTKIALTQAFGHEFITGIDAEKYVLEFSATQWVKWIAASDGFWDMCILQGEHALQDEEDILTKSAEELANKAHNRWKQKWNFYWNDAKPEIFHESSFPESNYDDIVVAIGTNAVVAASTESVVCTDISLNGIPAAIPGMVPIFEDSDYVAAMLSGNV